MPKKKAESGEHKTLKQELDEERAAATIRDLEASLAGDPTKTSRAEKLRELAARPIVPIHPLEIFLRERTIKHAEAAEAMGLKPRDLTAIMRDWGRPKDGELIAKMFGFESVEDLFPSRRGS